MTSFKEIPLDNLPVAMAYIPWQCTFETCDLNTALCIGTIFPCLNKPFEECCVKLNRGGFSR